MENLPGCKYCSRLQSNWKSFEEDVDDVVPIAHMGDDSSKADDEATVANHGEEVPSAKVLLLSTSSNWMPNHLPAEQVKSVKSWTPI